jgi:hypothetical protein
MKAIFLGVGYELNFFWTKRFPKEKVKNYKKVAFGFQ